MLFNKNGHGSEELHDLSGTFDAGTPYKAIAADVDAAARQLAGIVGPAVVQRASELYAMNVPSEQDSEYLDMVRRPIALLAIANYSKSTIVSHGKTGRRMVVGDNEKIPFEWMIDRDDREMRERYHRFMDALFSYLSDGDFPEWTDSSAFRRSRSCLVASLAQMEDVYPVNNSQYTYFTLLPLLLEKQKVLSALVGPDGFARIQEDSDGSLAATARKFIVLKALVAALKRWSIAVFPTEVARQFAPSYQGNRENRTATTEEIEWTISKLEDEIADAQADLLTELSGNPYEGFPLIPNNDPKNKYFTV